MSKIDNSVDGKRGGTLSQRLGKLENPPKPQIYQRQHLLKVGKLQTRLIHRGLTYVVQFPIALYARMAFNFPDSA